LTETANVTRSAEAVKMHRNSAYHERARNELFAAGWKAAIGRALDDLELAALERAAHGYDKDVVYQGERTDKIRLYSDALLMFLLRAHRPEVYDKASGKIADIAQSADDMRAQIEAKLAGDEEK
jgi:hypothetical protein